MIADFLLLVGDHLTLARLAHAVTFYGLGEDDSGAALVIDSPLVGVVNLGRIMSSTVQPF